MISVDAVKESLLAEATDDFLGLWEVLWEVREELGIKTAPADRQETLVIVRDLLEEGLLEPGFPVGRGAEFTTWNVEPDKAMQRIEAAWDALDDDPFTGDIVWFTATAKGEQWLREKQAENRHSVGSS